MGTKFITCTLSNLPGRDTKSTQAAIFRDADELYEALKTHDAAMAQGENGAIHVWRDDAGAIRCNIQRFKKTIDEATYETVRKARPWVVEWLHKIN